MSSADYQIAPGVWASQVAEEPTPAPPAEVVQLRPETTPPPWVDIAAILAGTEVKKAPTKCTRRDGKPTIYSAAVNQIFGPSEGGKTWVVTLAGAQELLAGGRTLWIDLDYNGATTIVERLQLLGVPDEVLADPDKFRFYEPEDSAAVVAIVDSCANWAPEIAVVDSMGELLPLFGVNSNDSDQYAGVHRRVLGALAMHGAAVLVIDHTAKGVESRAQGAGGTVRKRAALDGVAIRVSVKESFTPGLGGASFLSVNKDRPGKVRELCQRPASGGEPYLGMFAMSTMPDGSTYARIEPPTGREQLPNFATSGPGGDGRRSTLDVGVDADQIADLTPAPATVREVKERLGWGTTRASAALSAFRSRSSTG